MCVYIYIYMFFGGAGSQSYKLFIYRRLKSFQRSTFTERRSEPNKATRSKEP